ncbi:MAG: PCMD domain-containing protein [Bacteroidales bacterium]
MKKVSYYVFSSVIITALLMGASGCDEPDEPDNNSDDNTQVSDAGFDGNFENWITHTEGEVSWEIPESGWWSSLNMLKTLGCPLTMTKTEDAYAGNYAVRLETINWGDDLIIPGIIASGYFDKERPIGENLVLGQPFEYKATLVRGYYKYHPATQDTAVFYTSLTRYNTSTNQRDTIAEASLTINDSIRNYTEFQLIYEYRNYDQQPDSINILFLTSISGQDFNGHVGSTLFIDDVEIIEAADQ